MLRQTHKQFVPTNKATDSSPTPRLAQRPEAASSSVEKPAAIWESPTVEEFNLCMEVTAYVQQWD
ncbi:MAG: pyrroloquinoline quinone precursor peptide PqqA [Microcoleaceae cyanobacterium]